VPSYFRTSRESIWPNGASAVGMSSGFMPIPVSETDRTGRLSAAAANLSSTLPPALVNLIAFDSRFSSNCRNF
jgi:hypothetical protein